MPPQTLVRRLESLEQRVTVLEQLPARLDDLASQILQLRAEMRAEFSAVRDEIRAGDERILNQACMLHEQLVSHLKLIEEGRASRRKPSSRE